MDSYDDMDIEEMINNPFRNIDLAKSGNADTQNTSSLAERAKVQSFVPPVPQMGVGGNVSETMETNHPVQDRTLSLEKNALLTDKRIDTVKRIIEEQNERIDKMEQELELLRSKLLPSDDGDELEIDIDDE